MGGYTFGMKTAISLPERVFRDAERFARRVRKTRSKLYAEAIAEYLARHAPNDITESMNQVCDRIGVPVDKFQGKAARQILSKKTW
jgi:metal-responsive CopG/Arc/MetJ family transcriptional regulator